MKITLLLLACLGLCSCAYVPESDDSFDQQQYVAPVAPVFPHQQFVTPLPQGAAFQGSVWDASPHLGGEGGGSPIPNMFAPPQPPFSY